MSLTDSARKQLRETLNFYRGQNMANNDQAALRTLLMDLMDFAESEGLDFHQARRAAKVAFRGDKY